MNVFQSAAESQLNGLDLWRWKPQARTGLRSASSGEAAPCTWPGPARSNKSNRRPPRAEGQSDPDGGGVMWQQIFTEQKLVQRKKRKRENDFGRTFLKLCWVVIGWLPPLAFPASNTDSRYTLFTYMTIFTLHWLEEQRCSVRFSSWTQQSGNALLFGKRISVLAKGNMAGKGSDVRVL